MIAEIIKILPIKKSQTEGAYIRVEFKGENGSWYKTDLVPGYRNYIKWAKVLKVGNRVFNVELKDSQTINADSQVMLLTGQQASRRSKKTQEAWAKANRLMAENPKEFYLRYLS